MSDPVKPEEVPDTLVRVALDTQYPGYSVSLGSALARNMRTLLAAVLTEARDQIADWACGERTLTNQEMTEVAAELERGPGGDPGAVYMRCVRRLIEAWPRGYGG